MARRVLVLIDTEDGFRQKLDDFVRLVPQSFGLERVTPTVGLGDEELVADVVERASQAVEPTALGAFLVDLVVREERDPYGEGKVNYDKIGVRIAVSLRRRFPCTPIFVVTGKYVTAAEQALVSEASLEDVDGVLLKSYLAGPGVSVERLDKVLEKGRLKRSGGAPPANLLRGRAQPALGRALPVGLQAAGSRLMMTEAVERLGPRFGTLVEQLLGGAEGTIQTLRPGRSGAAVFLVRAKSSMGTSGLRSRSRSWVIKVAENAALLEKEVQNYAVLEKSGLDRTQYPQLLGGAPRDVDGLWGLAMSCEASAVTLREYFSRARSPTAAENIATRLGKALEALYGDERRVRKPLWEQYWKEDDVALRSRLAAALSDVSQAAREQGLSRALRNVSLFVESNGRAWREAIESRIDEWQERWIHGDMNSGNVLVTRDGRIVLIDFAAAGAGHVARDFAKLERDVLFRVCDPLWSSSSRGWNRLAVWQGLAAELHLGMQSSRRASPTHRVLRGFAWRLRAQLISLCATLRRDEYLVASVFFGLTALTIPELSLERRVFGVWYVSELLQALKAARPSLLKDCN